MSLTTVSNLWIIRLFSSTFSVICRYYDDEGGDDDDDDDENEEEV
jgi:hypothetical protein